MFQSYTSITQPTKLPSFDELLTSIPLPSDFCKSEQKKQNQVQAQEFAKPAPYHPQPVHYIPLQLNNRPITQTQGYVTYQRNLNSSVSPRTILDNSIEIPTPPPSTDSLPSPQRMRTYTPTSESPRSNSSSTEASPKTNIKRKHVCKTCSRSFTTSGHLARHNRIHTGERKHICPWPTCDARFARQDNCMQHYKTHTNGKNKRSKLNFKNSNITKA